MANTQAMCTSFKVDALAAILNAGNTIKAALYVATGSLGAGTTAYSSTNEVTGTNYTAGGVAVSTGTAPTSSGTTAYWTPSADFTFTNVTLSTSFDAVLVYNDTAAGKNAISVHTFTAQTVTAGTFSLTMPTNNSSTALVKIT